MNLGPRFEFYSAHLSGMAKVLIGDPDELLLAAYRDELCVDFDLSTARSGLECLANLRVQAPDVLVLEPQLPWGGADGLLEVMQQIPRLAGVPIMICTSCRDVHILRGVAPFRISDYCVKPLADGELTRRIHALLDRQQMRFAAADGEETNQESWSIAAEFHG